MEIQVNEANLTEEDLTEWKSLPVTQAYFREINLKIKDHILLMGDGVSINKDNIDFTVQETNRLAGKIEAYRDVLDIELDKD